MRHPLVLAAAVLFCRLVLALVLIPPWQQPDETAHVAVAEAFRARLAGFTTRDVGRQAEILQSMAWHNWWGHYGLTTPAPIPTRFITAGQAADTLGIDPGSPNYQRPYYTLAATALSLASLRTVVGDLYIMRGLSAVFAMLTLWVAWRGAREALGDAGGMVVTLLLALHPQFAVVGTMASPDALVNLAAAIVWWMSMVGLRRNRVALPLAGVWLAAGAAASSDRLGVPLLLSALLVSLVVVARRTMSRWLLVSVGALGASGIGAVLWFINVSRATFSTAAWTEVLPLPGARTWEFFSSFHLFLFSSWWFVLGWMRYRPASWWFAIVILVSAAAVVGLLRLLGGRVGRERAAVALVALVITAVQFCAVYWTYYRMAGAPQGRHLFPALIPMLVLLWLGFEAVVPSRFRLHAGLALVAVFVVLDATAWLTIGVRAYGV